MRLIHPLVLFRATDEDVASVVSHRHWSSLLQVSAETPYCESDPTPPPSCTSFSTVANLLPHGMESAFTGAELEELLGEINDEFDEAAWTMLRSWGEEDAEAVASAAPPIRCRTCRCLCSSTILHLPLPLHPPHPRFLKRAELACVGKSALERQGEMHFCRCQCGDCP